MLCLVVVNIAHQTLIAVVVLLLLLFFVSVFVVYRAFQKECLFTIPIKYFQNYFSKLILAGESFLVNEFMSPLMLRALKKKITKLCRRVWCSKIVPRGHSHKFT